MNPAIPELFDLTDLASALDYTCCLLSHDNTSQWSGVKKKKKKWWLTSMKIREHCLSRGKKGNFIQGTARESSPFTETGYKLPRLRHTDWSCCEFWIRKCFSPFYARPQSKITHLYHCSKKTQSTDKDVALEFQVTAASTLFLTAETIFKKGRGEGKQ